MCSVTDSCVSKFLLRMLCTKQQTLEIQIEKPPKRKGKFDSVNPKTNQMNRERATKGERVRTNSAQTTKLFLYCVGLMDFTSVILIVATH